MARFTASRRDVHGRPAVSEVDRHAGGEETAAGGVRRSPVGARELRLRLRQLVGAPADEAAHVDVEREVAADAELEPAAELTAEVAVVLVERRDCST